MFSLKEYREPTRRLPELLPWAVLIGPGIVLQKDGLLQKTVVFRGPDLGASSPHELAHITRQLNNALMRLGSGWSLFVESQRFRTREYPTSRWQHPAAWIVDTERSRHFTEGTHFESSYYLTFVWQLPTDTDNRLQSFFYEDEGGSKTAGDPKREREQIAQDIAYFRKTVGETVTLLALLFPSVAELDDDQTLTYLHSCISTQRHPVRTPEVPMYLDAILPDVAFHPGEISMLGDQFLLTCTITGFPPVTTPGILDALNYLQTEYRWVTRYIAMDKQEAEPLLEAYRRKWTQKRKGLFTMLKEQAAGGAESRLINEAADDKASDAGAALRALANDEQAFGYFTTTVTVWDSDLERVRQKMQGVKQAIQSQGFTVHDETINSREAWLGSLPGHVYANVRRPIVGTLNLAQMIPASSVWTGAAVNQHLEKVTGGTGTPHLLCTTTGATAFRLSLNVDDVGHTLIVGPTGAGKSTLLSLLCLQWLKYPAAQVIILDKDRSARAATLAVGGSIFEPGNAEARSAFQPLRHLDEGRHRTFASEFVASLFEAQQAVLTPALKEAIEAALATLATRPEPLRTVSELAHVLRSHDPAYAQVLMPYCTGGVFGQIFDASEGQVHLSRWTMIEMGHLMELGPAAIVPALLYLAHEIDRLFTGAPTLWVWDEAWRFLSNASSAAWLQGALKTLRKKNVFVVFATQEVADAFRNADLQSTILSACATKIFLADPEATTPAMASDYARLGLTPTEIGNLARMQKKRDYYLRSSAGRRVFSLGLGPAQLTFVGMSSEQDQRFLDRMVATCSPAEYAEAMLEHRRVEWAVEEMRARRSGQGSRIARPEAEQIHA